MSIIELIIRSYNLPPLSALILSFAISNDKIKVISGSFIQKLPEELVFCGIYLISFLVIRFSIVLLARMCSELSIYDILNSYLVPIIAIGIFGYGLTSLYYIDLFAPYINKPRLNIFYQLSALLFACEIAFHKEQSINIK